MTVSVSVTGSAARSVPSSVTTNPPPGTLSLPVTVANAGGDWMIAVISWRDPPGGYPSPTMTVADDAHNWWEPLVTPNISVSLPAGNTRSCIWMAPAARAAQNVYVAPSAYTPALAAIIYDVAGLQPWVSATAATSYSNNNSTIAASLAAPASQAVVVTVCGTDNNSRTVSLAGGGGWSSVTTVTASNGTDHGADISCKAAWQVTSGGTTATWSSSGSLNLSLVVGGPLVSAPALTSRSPHWPVMIWEAAPGAGMLTAPDALTWRALTAQALSLDVTQGRQFETEQLATGEGTLLLDNPAGNLIPPGSGTMGGIDSGTPVRIRAAWQGGSWQLQFHGNGAVGPAVSTGPVAVSAQPGKVYTASAWLGSSGTWNGAAELVLIFYNGGGTAISSATSNAVPGPAAGMAVASGTAPAGTVDVGFQVACTGVPASTVTISAAAAPLAAASSGYAAIPPATTWAAGTGTTITLSNAMTPDPNGPPNISPWYVPFSGFIERLPQQWDDQLRGYTEASVTDSWFSANYNPQPILPTEILNDFPYAYWPLTDDAGSTQGSNLAPGNNNPLLVTQSAYGATGTSYAFGQSGDDIPGSQATFVIGPGLRVSNQGGMWQQTLKDPPNLGQNYSLTCRDGGFPQPPAGMTLEFWFQTSTATGGTLPTGGGTIALCWLISPSPVSPFQYEGVQVLLQRRVDLGGNGRIYLAQNSKLAWTQISPGTINYWLPGQLVTHVAITFNASSWNSYINGQFTASGNWPVTMPSLYYLTLNGLGGLPLASGAVDPGGTGITAMSGVIGQVAIWPLQLAANRIATHFQAGIAGLAGEYSEWRIERLLQAGNATGRRIILQQSGSDVTPVVSCQDMAGNPASASISNIVQDLLPGMFLVAPTGDLFHLSRQHTWGQAPAWTLGEHDYAGEYPYQPGISYDYDPSRIQNEIQLTQLDNQDTITPSVTAVETASQQRYGTISNLATGYLEGDALQPLNYGPGLYDLANWLATTYQKPVLRLSQVTVDAATNPLMWPFVLGGSVGDVTVVNRRPPSSSNTTISVTGRITQTQRSLRYSAAGVEAKITCVIDPAPETTPLTLDDPVKGQLSGTNILAW